MGIIDSKNLNGYLKNHDIKDYDYNHYKPRCEDLTKSIKKYFKPKIALDLGCCFGKIGRAHV